MDQKWKDLLVEKVDLDKVKFKLANNYHQAFNFLNKIKDGDKIWSWSTDSQSWMMLMGNGGYIIIRNDEVVDSILTIMN